MYIDTDSFVIHIKIEGFYEDLANGVEKWLDTSNYDEDNKKTASNRQEQKINQYF